MPIQLLLWLLAFIVQSGLLGVAMYQLVQLTDLEADYVNPHDASKNYNNLVVSRLGEGCRGSLCILISIIITLVSDQNSRTQLPDYAAQAGLTALHLLSGNWAIGSLHAVCLAYLVQRYRQRRHAIDVTEVFRDVGSRRKAATVKMIFHLLAFIWTIYRFIQVLVVSLITPQGRTAARSILREAAASLHRRRAGL